MSQLPPSNLAKSFFHGVKRREQASGLRKGLLGTAGLRNHGGRAWAGRPRWSPGAVASRFGGRGAPLRGWGVLTLTTRLVSRLRVTDPAEPAAGRLLSASPEGVGHRAHRAAHGAGGGPGRCVCRRERRVGVSSGQRLAALFVGSLPPWRAGGFPMLGPRTSLPRDLGASSAGRSQDTVLPCSQGRGRIRLWWGLI